MLLKDLIRDFHLNIKGILHVGACYCEELESYMECGISKDKILWIEANGAICDQVHNRDPHIKIHNAIISNQDDQEVDFIVTNNLQSSSILELDLHKIIHPNIHESFRYKVRTKTIDTFFR